MNLWGRDLLQHWETQINITSTSGTSCQMGDVPDEGNKKCYQKQLQTIQVVHRQETAGVSSLNLKEGTLL